MGFGWKGIDENLPCSTFPNVETGAKVQINPAPCLLDCGRERKVDGPNTLTGVGFSLWRKEQLEPFLPDVRTRKSWSSLPPGEFDVGGVHGSIPAKK
jgi:hypothetical protein